MTDTQMAFAKGHLQIYLRAREQYLQTNFWQFKRRNDLNSIMRTAQYLYKRATGKNIPLEALNDK